MLVDQSLDCVQPVEGNSPIRCQNDRRQPKLTLVSPNANVYMRRLPSLVRVKVESATAYSKNCRLPGARPSYTTMCSVWSQGRHRYNTPDLQNMQWL